MATSTRSARLAMTISATGSVARTTRSTVASWSPEEAGGPLSKQHRENSRAPGPPADGALYRLPEVAAAGTGLHSRREAVPGLPLDALLLTLALVFASEEERYPRPRYRGSDVAVERILELIG